MHHVFPRLATSSRYCSLPQTYFYLIQRVANTAIAIRIYWNETPCFKFRQINFFIMIKFTLTKYSKFNGSFSDSLQIHSSNLSNFLAVPINRTMERNWETSINVILFVLHPAKWKCLILVSRSILSSTPLVHSTSPSFHLLKCIKLSNKYFIFVIDTVINKLN